MKIWMPVVQAGTGSDVFTKRLAAGLRSKGISVDITWLPHYLEVVPHLLRFVRAPDNADIIHVNSWNGFAFVGKAKHLVVTVHHCVHDPTYSPYRTLLQSAYHSMLIRRYEQLSFHAAAAVTAVSHFTAGRVSDAFTGVHPLTIYNGIDTDLFAPEQRAGAKTGPFRMLFLGTPSRRKGFDLLEPLMEKLGDDFELYYSTGRHSRQLAQRRNIHCLGMLGRQALRDAYHECDVLLFPSRYEGFGYVICEAMACGKPVIASNCSSLPELVKDRETGLLCPVDDVEAFVQAARTLASDRDFAMKLGNAGRQRVLEHFTLEAMVDRYIELYKSL